MLLLDVFNGGFYFSILISIPLLRCTHITLLHDRFAEECECLEKKKNNTGITSDAIHYNINEGVMEL
jgi:hypothetical protein